MLLMPAIFSRVLRDSTPRFVGPLVHRSVGPSVRWSVGPSVRRSVGPSVRPSVGPSVRPSVTLYFFGVYGVFGYTALAQMLHRPHI